MCYEYKHATHRLLVIWGRNAPVGGLFLVFLVFLLVCCRGRRCEPDELRSRTRPGRLCQRLIDESSSPSPTNPS